MLLFNILKLQFFSHSQCFSKKQIICNIKLCTYQELHFVQIFCRRLSSLNNVTWQRPRMVCACTPGQGGFIYAFWSFSKPPRDRPFTKTQWRASPPGRRRPCQGSPPLSLHYYYVVIITTLLRFGTVCCIMEGLQEYDPARSHTRDTDLMYYGLVLLLRKRLRCVDVILLTVYRKPTEERIEQNRF